MKRTVALLAFAVVALAVTGGALAHHSWGHYHWARTANPLSLKVGDNVSSGWDGYLSTAVGDWNASDVLDLTQTTGAAGSGCSPTGGRIEVCNGNYGNTGWLGVAQIWVQSRGHIYQATTRVNDTYMNQAPYNTAPWHRLVMCQEVGHDFGLDHQDENFNNANLATCMDYTSDPDGPPSNEHPNQHDYDQLAKIYSHLDNTNTAFSGSAAELPGNAPPFSQASRANGSVYFDNLGNGRARVTFVFWTPFGD